LTQTLARTSEAKGTSKLVIFSAACRFEVPPQGLLDIFRNFKSAAL
jgi:hypothetical protein